MQLPRLRSIGHRRWLGLDTILDGRIRWTNGRSCEVLSVGPAGIDLLDPEALVAWTRGVGGWLNALTHSIQWLLMIRPAGENSAVQRQAYLVVDTTGARGAARAADGSSRTEAARTALLAAGAAWCEPLTDRALVGFLAEVLGACAPSPDAPVDGWAGAGLGAGAQWSADLVMGPALFARHDRLELHDRIRRLYYLHAFPSSFPRMALRSLGFSSLPLTLSIRIDPVAVAEAIALLSRRIRDFHGSRAQARLVGAQEDFRLPKALQDADALRRRLHGGETRLFTVEAVMALDAGDEAEAAALGAELELRLRQELFSCHLAYFGQLEALEAMLPGKGRLLRVGRHLPTEATCRMLPLAAATRRPRAGAVHYGLHPVDRSDVSVARFGELEHPAGFFLGTSGSGKSTLAKLEILRTCAVTDADVVVVDPEGEYGPLIGRLGGHHLDLAPGSPERLNVMDLGEGPNALTPQAKSATLVTLLEPLIGPLRPEDRSTLDGAILETYRRHPSPTATLAHLVDVLASSGGAPLHRSLDYYVHGSLGMFAAQSTPEELPHAVAFDLHRFDPDTLPLVLPFLLEHVWTRLRDNRGARPTLITVDEVHLLLRHPATRAYFLTLLKRARKWGAQVTGITQSVGDFLDGLDGRTILAGGGFVVLLNQSPADVPRLADVLKLSRLEQQHIVHQPVGRGLLLAGPYRSPVQIRPQGDELALIAPAASVAPAPVTS